MGVVPSMVSLAREALTPEAISPRWSRTAVGRAEVRLDGGLRLLLHGALPAHLALAQLDDYIPRARQDYAWRAPLLVETRARFSHPGGEFAGTAGFGLWNNPAPLWGTRMEVRPNWVWFYYASPHSTLSLMPGPPHGFKAAVIHSEQGSSLATTVCEALLKAPVLGRRLAGSRLPAVEMTLDKALMAGWHTYRIAWLPGQVSFQVDGYTVLEARQAPQGPLAFVAWVDNSYAALDARGEMQTGWLALDRPQWLELEYLSLGRP